MLIELNNIIEKDLRNLSAKEFLNLICSLLKKGELKKEVFVSDRYDGRTGRVDILYKLDGLTYGIELDRFSPRNKSIFKLNKLNPDFKLVITRAPVKITSY